MIRKSNVLGPTGEQERLPLLDVLRGASILGILLNNMGAFSGPSRELGFVALSSTATDRVGAALVLFFVNGKSYLLFALLFGLGFEMQLTRATARGASILPSYSRRVLLLFVIGVGHAVFLWEGDILAMYATLGCGLLLIRTWPPRAILAAALVLFLLSPVTEWISVKQSFGDLATGSTKEASAELSETPAERAQAIYGYGDYIDVVAYRLKKLPSYAEHLWLNQALSGFAVFVFGLYVGRRRLIEGIAKQAALWRGRMPWILAAALVANSIYVVAFTQGRVRSEILFLTLGGPLFCFVYIIGLGLLVGEPRWRARLAPLAAVGRLSLTNYLMQSVVCTTLFYGYGFGLYGRLGTTATLLIAFAIFTMQMFVSSWWLKYFRLGPLEWFLRSFIYYQWQAFRRAAPAASRGSESGGLRR